jgi:hypothetical protein
MGLFDLPAPLLSWLDGGLGLVAPPTLRLMLWGLAAAALSMALYWLLSPQRELAVLKRRVVEARRALDAYDGEFAGGWPLMRHMFGLSLKQLGLTTWPAVVASLPILALIGWLSTTYGYSLPGPETEVGVRAEPGALPARLTVNGTDSRIPAHIQIADADGRALHDIALTAPVTLLHKRQWWNALFGNPAGYLPDDSQVERVEIGLPANDYLGIGPPWLGAWYMVFFTTLLLGSLAIKIAGRIE